MILRPLEPEPANDARFAPAWPVVERLQRQVYEQCWMITQPSHAALSGELAAKMKTNRNTSSSHLPQLDPDLTRAIAMHDAGWGLPDAQAVMASRSSKHEPPKSFLETGVPEFLAAWTQSIDTVQPISAAGGYMVSRHFWRLADHRLSHGGDDASHRKKIEDFLVHETARQKRLAAKQSRAAEELEHLTDLLQLFDLLSLYICAGAQENVEFPECLGMRLKLIVEAEGYRCEPELIEKGAHFSVAALRHPATKDKSGEELPITMV
jgi:hypothetical protein